ncbi:hypothetical protein [Mixta calida]|uniref:hypothetical protein n=1 Tax=Mixta calida TaxID=665913 RepID=UPI0029069E0C|nr:hypothetical protein [Mixta calida]MDU4291105.1 hypothetical protein [Mixta calida]
MKQITRIPVQADSVLPQAVRLFEMLKQRGKDVALIVPDAQAAVIVKNSLGLTDKHVLNAGQTRDGVRHWLLGRSFPVFIVASLSRCEEAISKAFAGEGEFLKLLAHRQSLYEAAHIYAFTESRSELRYYRKRVTTDTQRGGRAALFGSLLGPF